MLYSNIRLLTKILILNDLKMQENDDDDVDHVGIYL